MDATAPSTFAYLGQARLPLASYCKRDRTSAVPASEWVASGVAEGTLQPCKRIWIMQAGAYLR